MISGIYAILNIFNDKYYIGSATDFKYGLLIKVTL